jgi:diguanylate cyclase (GGDEF)-like protein/PAS domain S-box-containing protein
LVPITWAIVVGRTGQAKDEARRERILRRAAVGCIAAATPAGAARAIAEAIVDTLGRRFVAVAIGPAGEPPRAAIPSGPAALPRFDGAEPGAAPRLEGWAPGPGYAIPISVPGQPACAIFIAHTRRLRGPERHSLAALADLYATTLTAFAERAGRHARDSAQRFRALTEVTGTLVTLVDGASRILWQSPNARDLLGREAWELEGGTLADLVVPADAGRAREAVDSARAAGGEPVYVTLRVRHGDGEHRWFEMSLADLRADETVQAIVCQSHDVTARIALERDARSRALEDPLTRLPNRARLEELIDEELRRAEGPVSVIVLNVDDFKRINESLGHDAGDELLVQLGRRLAFAGAGAQALARLAGDAFALLAPRGAGGDAVAAMVDRLLLSLEAPLELGGRPVLVAATAGSAASEEGTTAAELIRHAEVALHRVREDGGTRHGRFRPEMLAEVAERAALDADLAGAIVGGELDVHFQPIADLQGGARWVGAEALVRWHHPVLGLIPPMRFVPLAERSGLIVALGDFVLRTACRRLAEWRAAGLVDADFQVNVNLSGVQLADPGLAETVEEALRAAELPGSALTVELTETVLSTVREARAQLTALRGMGVTVAIDDFGTGYSSLAYLKELPVDVLKVPRPFVKELGKTGPDGAIVAGVVGLAHALGMVSLAEGVETPEQADALAASGCRLVQGFRYGRPEPAKVFAAALAALREQRDAPITRTA